MSNPTTTTKKPVEELSFSAVMDKAAKSAIRGGTAGAVAMGANVACLMWMRTTVRKEKKRKETTHRTVENGGERPPVSYHYILHTTSTRFK
jgi:formiminotetrahydrofolate cyclodeaminase